MWNVVGITPSVAGGAALAVSKWKQLPAVLREVVWEKNESIKGTAQKLGRTGMMARATDTSVCVCAHNEPQLWPLGKLIKVLLSARPGQARLSRSTAAPFVFLEPHRSPLSKQPSPLPLSLQVLRALSTLRLPAAQVKFTGTLCPAEQPLGWGWWPG